MPHIPLLFDLLDLWELWRDESGSLSLGPLVRPNKRVRIFMYILYINASTSIQYTEVGRVAI